MTASRASTHPQDDPGDANAAAHRLALERTRAAQAEAEGQPESTWLRISRSAQLGMIAAVYEAALAGLGDDAVRRCMDHIRPLLGQTCGSDFAGKGAVRDALAIERLLRNSRVEDAAAYIENCSRLRWWVALLGYVLLCAITLAFWLLRR